jgi:hypothetical protein
MGLMARLFGMASKPNLTESDIQAAIPCIKTFIDAYAYSSDSEKMFKPEIPFRKVLMVIFSERFLMGDLKSGNLKELLEEEQKRSYSDQEVRLIVCRALEAVKFANAKTKEVFSETRAINRENDARKNLEDVAERVSGELNRNSARDFYGHMEFLRDLEFNMICDIASGKSYGCGEDDLKVRNIITVIAGARRHLICN